MRENQVALQAGRVARRDAGIGEFAEAGVDPIDGVIAGGGFGDERGRMIDCLARRRVKARGRAFPIERRQIVEADGTRNQDHGFGHEMPP